MLGALRRYTKWLHTQWPAGVVESLPDVREDFSTNVPGVYIVGDLTGIPLLKFSADSGARAVRTIVADTRFQELRTAGPGGEKPLDVAIVGAGISGMAAALEARAQGLDFEVIEATEPFSTIVNFPKGKPIYTYPMEMTPEGDLMLTAKVKEPLLAELTAQTLEAGITPRMAKVLSIGSRGGLKELSLDDGTTLAARSVIVGIGRSGNFRKLGIPGEELGKVYNRLHDPGDFSGMDVLVVGGGDSALETAIAITQCGGNVTLSYRGEQFSRPKPENIRCVEMLVADPGAEVAVETPSSERVTTSTGGYIHEPESPGSLRVMMGSEPSEIRAGEVVLTDGTGSAVTLPNDVVFSMIGREAPLDFFRRSGVRIKGEKTAGQWAFIALFLLFCAFVYNWKAGGSLTKLFQENGWFPFDLAAHFSSFGTSIAAMAQDPSTVVGTLSITATDAGFYYSVLYTSLIVIFGITRVKRRKTPYVKVQTITLAAVQVVPLFLLPYFVLPIMGTLGAFDAGIGKAVADELFPMVNYGYGREYWRSFGFILAWPLFIWNAFSNKPMVGWLIISAIQTFVIIPYIIYRWGKGAYCGFICSCGAMAETLGDTQRHKMPHGARWNRVNMVGQVILAIALLMLLFRIISWVAPGSPVGRAFEGVFQGMLYGWAPFGIQLNYKWVVDIMLAGIVGYGLYFWASGRVWCRFACPLAALMHIYARFSRFAILSEKKKCISCNVCTSVCHQGIDVMNFANKGLAMTDPECVRCSACVQSCPTGVLQFGEYDQATGRTIRVDSLAASPVLMREGHQS